MQTIYLIFLVAIGIIFAIGVGLEISHKIEDIILYFLFWILYIITIITFINIILVGNYYLTMRNKEGPPGIPGPDGNMGDKGQAGLCDPSCRDSICENQLLDLVTDELKTRNKGVAIKMNNVYIKSKLKQMCSSEEFKQLAPYNGPMNLINYLKDVWKIWIKLLFDAGGMKYFENVGAEADFDWLTNNPFNEMKKYDVFYWGMGKQYRPQIVDKCYNSNDGNTPITGSSGSIVRISKSSLFDFIINDKGIGAYTNVSFWRARQFTYKNIVYYPIGDIAYGPSRSNENQNSQKRVGNITFPYRTNGPARETIIVSGDLKGPINYELLWTNRGRRGNNIWIWRPIAPKNYISLGDVVTTNANPPQTGDNAPIRCVPKDIVNKVNPNGNILWSSNGARASSNINLLGFTPNNGSFVGSSDSNCYNLFRGVVGFGSTIPDSDVNGSFYKFNDGIFQESYQIGSSPGIPPVSNVDNYVGKGYVTPPPKDSKYSVMAYINLKNNPTLVHSNSKITLSGQLIPNAISNAYLIKYKNSCIKYDKTVSNVQCDEQDEKQLFSIVFTGNKTNECRLQHYKSGKILKYKDSVFTLVSADTITDRGFTLFVMS
jgi:hypothetical protein